MLGTKNYIAIQFYDWYVSVRNPFKFREWQSTQSMPRGSSNGYVITRIGFITVIYDGLK